jgi:MFS transporter, DHA1 family, multidrug resistance protein
LRIAPESFAFTFLLGLLAALPAVSIDISAPTLVLLPKALQTSTTVAGFTLSFFMIGFASGQLSGGRLSDRSGRRPVLLAGLCCFTAASIACTLSPSGPALVVSRLFQGLGAGACSVLSFAVVQDLFEGDAARAKRSYVTVVFGAVPMLAPALGAALIAFAGWRAVHGVLAIAGGILSIIIWLGVAESRRAGLELFASVSAHEVVRLRDDPWFVRLTLANALSYGCIFAYIAGSPVVIIGEMRLPSVVFAAVFASTAAALTAGAWTSGRLIRRGFGAATLLGPSLSVAAAATLALAMAGLAGVMSGAILLPLLLPVLFARGIIAPNLQHLAIERRQEQAGSASAAVGVSQLLSGALGSALVAALLPSLGMSAVAIPMALFAASALVVWRRIDWRQSASPSSSVE